MNRRPPRHLASWLSILVGTAVAWWFTVVPAAAQDEPYDGRSTDETVRLVVGGLVAIAVATAVAMFVYVWHTSPRRRQRIADERGGHPPPVD